MTQAKVDVDDLLSSMAECLIQSSMKKNDANEFSDLRSSNEEIQEVIKRSPERNILRPNDAGLNFRSLKSSNTSMHM